MSISYQHKRKKKIYDGGALISRRILSEISQTYKELKYESQLCVAVDERDPMRWTFLVVGPRASAYEDGFYIFNFTFPESYPARPPTVIFQSMGPLRIHPNLYVEGKVCLSILGTWSGPEWKSIMTGLGVARSIQSILDESPIKAEPAYEKFADTHQAAINYRIAAIYLNLQYHVIDVLNRLRSFPEQIQDCIVEYFVSHYEDYISQIAQLEQLDGTTVQYIHGYVNINTKKLWADFFAIKLPKRKRCLEFIESL